MKECTQMIANERKQKKAKERNWKEEGSNAWKERNVFEKEGRRKNEQVVKKGKKRSPTCKTKERKKAWRMWRRKAEKLKTSLETTSQETFLSQSKLKQTVFSVFFSEGERLEGRDKTNN